MEFRNCLKCNTSILYKYRSDFLKANRNNSLCKKCCLNNGKFKKLHTPHNKGTKGLYSESDKKRGDIQRGMGENKTYTKYLGRHQHRVIMEEFLGRPLTFNDVIHHIDGNKKNNNIENLQLMDRVSHGILHNTKNRICSINGCLLKHHSKGLCSKHYDKKRRLNKIIN